MLHLVEAGDLDRAEANARTIIRDELQVDALVRLAEATTRADRNRALVLMDEAGTSLVGSATVNSRPWRWPHQPEA